MKKILMAVLALVVILVALVLAHPFWIGPVVRTAVSQLAPKFLGVPAHLDGFSLNAYTGRVTLDGFALDNPPGCSERKFVTIGHLCLDVNPTTVLSDPIVVEEISLKDLFVSIVTDDQKVYNYKTVSAACSPSDAKDSKPEPKPENPKDENAKPAPKVIIDLIQVQNALVQWERVPLPLPSFRLTGLGRSTGGVEFEAAWTEAQKQFISSLGPLAQGLQAALAHGQVGLNAGLDTGVKAASEVSKSVESANKALAGLQKATSDGSRESAEAASKSVNEAVKSIEGSVKSLKSLFGK